MRKGVEFIGGFVGVDDKDDSSLRTRYGGLAWRHLAKEGVFDAIFVMSVAYDPKDPFGSTERIYRNVMANRGKAKVYFPMASYNFEKCSYREYAKLAKISEPEAVKRLMPQQPAKAFAPSVPTLSGSVTAASPVQPSNAASPIDVRSSPKLTDVSARLPAKARGPMAVTPAGRA